MAESMTDRIVRRGSGATRALALGVVMTVVLVVAGVLAVLGVDTVEVVATLMVVAVFGAAVFGGRAAGFGTAAVATGVYVVLRRPDLGSTGVPSFALLVVARAVAYGVVVYAGAWARSAIDARVAGTATADNRGLRAAPAAVAAPVFVFGEDGAPAPAPPPFGPELGEDERWAGDGPWRRAEAFGAGPPEGPAFPVPEGVYAAEAGYGPDGAYDAGNGAYDVPAAYGAYDAYSNGNGAHGDGEDAWSASPGPYAPAPADGVYGAGPEAGGLGYGPPGAWEQAQAGRGWEAPEGTTWASAQSGWEGADDAWAAGPGGQAGAEGGRPPSGRWDAVPPAAAAPDPWAAGATGAQAWDEPAGAWGGAPQAPEPYATGPQPPPAAGPYATGPNQQVTGPGTTGHHRASDRTGQEPAVGPAIGSSPWAEQPGDAASTGWWPTAGPPSNGAAAVGPAGPPGMPSAGVPSAGVPVTAGGGAAGDGGRARELPAIDPETRLWSARYLCDRLAAEQRRVASTGRPYSLVLVQVPDGPLAALSYRRQLTLLRELGHQFVAGGLVDHLVHVPDRSQHWFAVVLPGAGKPEAREYERRLRDGIGGYLRSRGLLLGELDSAGLTSPDDDQAMGAIWEALIARGDPSSSAEMVVD